MKTLIVKRWIAVPLVIAAVAGTVIGTKLLIDSNVPVKASESGGRGNGDLQDDVVSGGRDGNGVIKNEGGGRGGDLKDDAASDRNGNGVTKGEGDGTGGGRDLKDDAAGDRNGNGVIKNESGGRGGND